MQNKIKIFLFSSILCPEIIIFLLIILGYLYIPSDFAIKVFKLTTPNIKWVVSMNIVIISLTCKDSKDFLFPSDLNRKKLYNWPDYNLFKINYFIGLFYQFIFCVLGISVLLINFLTPSTKLIFIAGSLFGCVISYSTYLLAKPTLREIMEK